MCYPVGTRVNSHCQSSSKSPQTRFSSNRSRPPSTAAWLMRFECSSNAIQKTWSPRAELIMWSLRRVLDTQKLRLISIVITSRSISRSFTVPVLLFLARDPWCLVMRSLPMHVSISSRSRRRRRRHHQWSPRATRPSARTCTATARASLFDLASPPSLSMSVSLTPQTCSTNLNRRYEFGLMTRHDNSERYAKRNKPSRPK